MIGLHLMRICTVGNAGLVEYFCMRADHNAAPHGSASDHLTVVERAWAYCPKDAKLDGHVWEPTGGVAATDIERFARSREVQHQRDMRDAAAG
jgi:hypothetical protein